MRILFISWSTTGGSGISQRQLALELTRRGHVSRFVVFDKTASQLVTSLYGRLSDLSVRLERTPLVAPIRTLRDGISRRGRRSDIDDLWHVHSAVPQNTLPSAIDQFAPDVVVVSSVDRWAWRRIHEVCRALGVPTVLYVREEGSLDHLRTGEHPSILVANTPSLAAGLRARGFECSFLPSVVDVSTVITESTRLSALAINPIPIKGADVVWELARRLPDIRFVVQEAWKLQGVELEEVMTHVESLPNVEFRAAAPPGPHIYRDARVLLAPYRVDSRPRVILEAHTNGIPVLASDLPSLVDAVGSGGMNVDVEDIDAWTAALEQLMTDEDLYAELSAAALQHARRPEVDPRMIAVGFEQLLAPHIPPSAK